MLGKLLKYEFKTTGKLILIFYGVHLITTFLCAIILATGNVASGKTPNILFSIASALFFVAYLLTAFALFIVVFIYLCTHFYKTMYSSQGYLTHTLPVTSTSILCTKLFTAFCWMFGSVLLFCTTLYILCICGLHGDTTTLLQLKDELFSPNIESLFGISFSGFIGLLLLFAAVYCLNKLLMVYFCISVGQTFHSAKLPAAIITGIIIYFAEQIICLFILIAAGLTNAAIAMDALLRTVLISTSILYLLETAAYYITCHIITKKHINLD